MWFMIRKLQKTDINRVADIWLDTNLKAHDFIPAKYWKNNFQLVKICNDMVAKINSQERK